jgi:hypothetical protein
LQTNHRGRKQDHHDDGGARPHLKSRLEKIIAAPASTNTM